MKSVIRFALIAMLASPALAWAQPAPNAPTPAASMAGMTERDRLATTLIHLLMASHADAFQHEIVGGAGRSMTGIAHRPQWNAMFEEALAAEAATGLPKLEAILARYALKDFTVAELRIGLLAFDSPAGKAALAGEKPTAQSRAEEATLEASLRLTPDGRSFLRKFEAFPKARDDPAMIPECAAAILPGVFKRFGAMAEAAERARFAASMSDEARRLAAQFGPVFADAVGPALATPDSIDRFSKTFSVDGYPGTWPDLARSAASEAVAEDSEFIFAVLAAGLARGLSLDELRVGVDFIRTPDGRAAAVAFAAGEAPDAAGEGALKRLRATPVGRGFAGKLRNLNDLAFKGGRDDFIAVLTADLFRRFGEKVLAREAAIAAVS